MAGGGRTFLPGRGLSRKRFSSFLPVPKNDPRSVFRRPRLGLVAAESCRCHTDELGGDDQKTLRCHHPQGSCLPDAPSAEFILLLQSRSGQWRRAGSNAKARWFTTSAELG